MKFFECSVCGQIVGIVKDTRRPLTCCDEEMLELIPGTIDASAEKHVPICASSGTTVEVTVGSELHPMSGSHYIEWIALETEMGNQRKKLKPGDDPYVCFSICEGDKVIAAYAYCNLHKLWKGEDVPPSIEPVSPACNTAQRPAPLSFGADVPIPDYCSS